MSSAAGSIVVCDDGSEIAVEWVYAGAEDYAWQRDGEHWPGPMPPMELWLHEHWAAGTDRAWEEVAMQPPVLFYRFQYAGPFLYGRDGPGEPERLMPLVQRYREVAREHGGALKFWQEYCRPRIVRTCSELAATDIGAPLRSIAELWGYGFHQTFTYRPLLSAGTRRR